MPRHGLSPAQRAQAALQKLDERGGESALPLVVRSADVIPLMSRSWFTNALRLDLMPGMRVERGRVWRCDRATYLTWLRTLSGQASTGGGHNASAG